MCNVMENEEIICPACGCKIWKLYKSTFSDGDCGLRIVCCTPGCKVDNMTMFNNKVETVWQVIEADKL